jgi:hypothetical protein
MSFADARGILMGNESSATIYKTRYFYRSMGVQSCNKNSFTKVGADKYGQTLLH